jgi:uncharacterized membrane protein
MTPGSSGFQVLTAGTALGCGLAAGVFFAFSSFVMSGLDRLPPGEAIAAMQSINITAVRPLFMTALFGTAAACLPLIVIGFRHRDERVGVLLLIGAALYLLGTIGLTMGFHVPRNDALALLDPKRADAAAAWHDYSVAWTRANHLRTLAALGAAGAFTAALIKG